MGDGFQELLSSAGRRHCRDGRKTKKHKIEKCDFIFMQSNLSLAFAVIFPNASAIACLVFLYGSLTHMQPEAKVGTNKYLIFVQSQIEMKMTCLNISLALPLIRGLTFTCEVPEQNILFPNYFGQKHQLGSVKLPVLNYVSSH